MPTWTKSPPDDPRGQGLPLVRTPANGSLKAIVTSDGLIGTDTHFWGGHTVPCERPECDACEHRAAWRWHGYLSAYNPNDQLHFIFEMTAQAAHKFNDYLKDEPTLRGIAFEAYRWKHRRNGRVIIKLGPANVAPHALPRAPDLALVMSIIWRIPAPDVGTQGIERGAPKVYANSDRDGQSSDPKQYAIPRP